jgi:beta-glucosidase
MPSAPPDEAAGPIIPARPGSVAGERPGAEPRGEHEPPPDPEPHAAPSRTSGSAPRTTSGSEPLAAPDRIRFPDGFLWGVATSAYQIEGSPLADGAGPSIWHRFAHTPGRIRNGDTGDVACNHYRRYLEDLDLMRELGVTAYRFSISWSRILPQGVGAVNARGVGFYSRLIDCLLERDIRPFVTLYHWDLPAALDERRGWLNPDSVHWFSAYARVAFEAFGDRVPMWATLNEPLVVADAGYLRGVHAPGRHSLAETASVSHHLLCAHGTAVQLHRSIGRGRIGLVVNLEPKDPASQDSADLAAAERADAYANRQYLDPIFLGRYPEAMRVIFGEAWPKFPDRDLALIRQPIDFLGINYYTRRVVRHDEAAAPLRASAVPAPGRASTARGWEVYPEGLVRVLCGVRKRYGEIPLYITENGAAFEEPARAAGGVVDDPLRVRYLRDHLAAAHESLRLGVDLRGYFVWSLLDNFEWNHGYSMRFGLFHVDYDTQKRTPKASAHFYREVIRTNGGAVGEAAPREC